ncbi:MAG: hypothetical protein HPY52_15340 [Firmicutes bacterium]|nr:hypothetical protein [Bacillota bacterium]
MAQSRRSYAIKDIRSCSSGAGQFLATRPGLEFLAYSFWALALPGDVFPVYDRDHVAASWDVGAGWEGDGWFRPLAFGDI